MKKLYKAIIVALCILFINQSSAYAIGGLINGVVSGSHDQNEGCQQSTYIINAESGDSSGEYQWNEDIQKVAEALLNAGFTPAAAAGIMGNMQAESGFNPKCDSRGTGVGVFQLINGRADNMKKWCSDNGKSWDTIETQVAWLTEMFSTNDKGKLGWQGWGSNTDPHSGDYVPLGAAAYEESCWQDSSITEQIQALGDGDISEYITCDNPIVAVGTFLAFFERGSPHWWMGDDYSIHWGRRSGAALYYYTLMGGSSFSQNCSAHSSIDANDAVSLALSIAYDTNNPGYAGHEVLNNCKGSNGSASYPGTQANIDARKEAYGDDMIADCGYSAATIAKLGHGDETFPAGGTMNQLPYMQSSDKWEEVGYDVMTSLISQNKLQPGDIICQNGCGPNGKYAHHIQVYVGNEAIKKVFPDASDSYQWVSANQNKYGARIQESWNDNKYYHAFRYKG